MLNHITLKGPLLFPRHTEEEPVSHQEVDCFILTKLCLGAFFWNNHFWLTRKAGKLWEVEFYRGCQSQKRRQDVSNLEGFEGLQVPQKTLGVKNSQPSRGCLALCSTEPWINCSAIHSCCPMALVFLLSTLWMTPKACADTQVPHSSSPALVLECVKAIRYSALHFKTFWSQRFTTEKVYFRSSLLT